MEMCWLRAPDFSCCLLITLYGDSEQLVQDNTHPICICLKREAQCFCFPGFGFWRAQQRILRLSHSLLLVTAFGVFVWIPARLKLYT